MFENIEFIPLRVYPDSRGRVFHFIRPDWFPFEVKEVYGSWVYPGAVKGWHLHKEMTINYIVPVGNIKLVALDMAGENYKEFFLGEHCPFGLVRIPPGYWNGFMALDGQPALVLNAASHVHTTEEIVRVAPDTFDYNWLADRRG